MPEPHSSIVPAWTFRPMTRAAMTMERLAVETGHSAIEIIQHAGEDVRRNAMLAILRSLMFDPWDFLDSETGTWGPSPDLVARKWCRCRDGLMLGFGWEES